MKVGMAETTRMKEVSLEAGDDGRVTWDSPVQFFFTVLGFCVGLRNIWRFLTCVSKMGEVSVQNTSVDEG